MSNNENSLLANKWPFKAAIIAAIVALLGNWYNGFQAGILEKKQFESNLILKYMIPGDSSKSISNIRFLIGAGFISKNNDKIINIIRNPIYKIQFPKNDTIVVRPKNKAIVYTSKSNAFLARVVDQDNGKPIEGVKIEIDGYGETKTDPHGLCEIPLPTTSMVKVSITKSGYNGIYKTYITRQLHNLHNVPMSRL